MPETYEYYVRNFVDKDGKRYKRQVLELPKVVAAYFELEPHTEAAEYDEDILNQDVTETDVVTETPDIEVDPDNHYKDGLVELAEALDLDTEGSKDELVERINEA
jgi:hypothetical protein